MLIQKFSLLFVTAALASAIAVSPVRAELKFDAGFPADLREQMVGDLKLATTLQGDGASASYRAIFGTTRLDGAGLLAFFEQRILRVGLNDCGGGAAVAACVIPMSDNNKMWITPNYTHFAAPQLFRLAIVMHESRHSEAANRFWGHVTCPTPYRDEAGNDIKGILSGALMAGKPACDKVILGAYALQATLFKNIEKHCTTCNEKLRQDAQLYGDDTILRISNVPLRKKLRQDLNGG